MLHQNAILWRVLSSFFLLPSLQLPLASLHCVFPWGNNHYYKMICSLSLSFMAANQNTLNAYWLWPNTTAVPQCVCLRGSVVAEMQHVCTHRLNRISPFKYTYSWCNPTIYTSSIFRRCSDASLRWKVFCLRLFVSEASGRETSSWWTLDMSHCLTQDEFSVWKQNWKQKSIGLVWWREKRGTVLNKLVLSLVLHVETVSDSGEKLVPSGRDPAAKGLAPSCPCVLLQ